MFLSDCIRETKTINIITVSYKRHTSEDFLNRAQPLFKLVKEQSLLLSVNNQVHDDVLSLRPHSDGHKYYLTLSGNPSKHWTLTQCCFNIYPSSSTLSQHWDTVSGQAFK